MQRSGKYELLWIIVGKVAVFSGSVFFVKIMTESLTVGAFGTLSLLLAFTGAINQITYGAVTQGISRYYVMALEGNWLSEFLVTSIKLLIYATLLSLFIWFIIFGAIYNDVSVYTPLIILFIILYYFISGINGALNGLQNAARQRKIVALHNGIGSWLKLLIFMIFAYFTPIRVELALVSLLAAVIIIFCSQLLFAKKHFIKHIGEIHLDNRIYRNKFRREIWEFSWPVSFWGIFTGVHLVSDRFLLEHFYGSEDVAYYSVLFQLGYSPIIILISLSVTYFTPILYEQFGLGDDKKRKDSVKLRLKSITRYTSVLIFIFCVILTLFHKQIFMLLVDDNYSHISHLLPLMCLAGGIFATTQIVQIQLQIEERIRELMSIKIFSAVVGIISNVVMTINFGFIGTILSMGIFSTIYLIILLVCIERSSEIN